MPSAACADSTGSIAITMTSQPYKEPQLGLIREDTIQVAVETWRLHPFFDSSEWSLQCDVLDSLLRELSVPQAQHTPPRLPAFPELLQSVSPADFGSEFSAKESSASTKT